MEGLDRSSTLPMVHCSIFRVVRNHNAGLSAEAVDYDVHPELALKALDRCAGSCELPVKLVMIPLWSCSCG